MDLVSQQAMMILMLSNVAAIGLLLLMALVRRRSVAQHLQLQSMNPLAILPIILLGAGANLLMSLLLSAIPFPEHWMQNYEAAYSMIPDEATVISFLSVALLGPITEELAFRGLVYTRLRSGMPKLAAAILSSLLFGLVHGDLIWFFYTVPMGLLLVWLLERFQTLWAPMLLHIAFNAASSLLSLLPETTVVSFALLGAGIVLCAGSTVWIFRLTRQKAPLQTAV